MIVFGEPGRNSGSNFNPSKRKNVHVLAARRSMPNGCQLPPAGISVWCCSAPASTPLEARSMRPEMTLPTGEILQVRLSHQAGRDIPTFLFHIMLKQARLTQGEFFSLLRG